MAEQGPCCLVKEPVRLHYTLLPRKKNLGCPQPANKDGLHECKRVQDLGSTVQVYKLQCERRAMLQHSPHCNLATLLDMSAPTPHVVCLEQILPWNSTCAVYDNTAACFLLMCNSWALCPRYHHEVTEWLCVYQCVWVHYLCHYVLSARTNFRVAERCCNHCPIHWCNFAQQ
jgi:hypothetical protein